MRELPQRRDPDRWMIFGWAALVALFAFEAQYVRMPFDSSWGDEGFFANGALRLLDGQVPYRDYQHNYTPGRIFSLAFLVHALGHQLVVIRLCWCAFYALASALTFSVARRLMSLPWAILAAISVGLNLSNMNKSAELAASALVLWALARSLEDSRRSLAAGLLVGAAFLFRQDTGVAGVVLFGGSQLVLAGLAAGWPPGRRWIEHLRGGWPFAVGFFVVNAPFGIYLFWHGAMSAAIHDVVLSGFVANRALSLPFPSLFLELSVNGVLEAFVSQRMLFYSFPVLCAAGALRAILLIRRGSRDRGLLLLAIATLGGGLFLQVLPRSDWPHLQKAYVPVHILAAYLCSCAIPWMFAAVRHRRIGTALLGAPLVLAVLAQPLLQLRWSTLHGMTPWSALRYGHRMERVAFPHGELRLLPGTAAPLQRIVDIVEGGRGTHDEQPQMLTFTSGALFNFLFDIPTPLRYDTLRPGELRNNSPVVLDEIVATLRRTQPLYLLYVDEGANPEVVARILAAAERDYFRIDGGHYTLFVHRRYHGPTRGAYFGVSGASIEVRADFARVPRRKL